MSSPRYGKRAGSSVKSAKLLQTADAAMGDRSWNTFDTKAVTPSTTVNTADEWLPDFAFRCYESEDQNTCSHSLEYFSTMRMRRSSSRDFRSHS